MDRDLKEMLRLANVLNDKGLVTIVSKIVHKTKSHEFYQTIIEIKRSAQFGELAKDYKPWVGDGKL